MSEPLFWRDPAVPHLELRCARGSHAAYLAHSHAELSIGAVDAGESLYTCSAGALRLRPGYLVVIPAQSVHACNPHPVAQWGYRMLHVASAWFAEHALVAPDAPAVYADAALYRAFGALETVLRGAGDAATKHGALRGFLAQLGRTRPLAQPATGSGAAAAALLAAVHGQLRGQWAAAPSVKGLAHALGMSPYQFIRTFARRTGLTPHAWLLDQRIQRARVLLRRGGALAQIALELGFADQSHFQRAFKQRVATTPRRYRNSIQPGAAHDSDTADHA